MLEGDLPGTGVLQPPEGTRPDRVDAKTRITRVFSTAEEVDAFARGDSRRGAPIAIAVGDRHRCRPTKAGAGARRYRLELRRSDQALIEDPNRAEDCARREGGDCWRSESTAFDAAALRARCDALCIPAVVPIRRPAAAKCWPRSTWTGNSAHRPISGRMCVRAVLRSCEPQIDERGFRKIYEEIDLPLADVLARMEQTGIRVEPSQLGALSTRMDAEMQRLARRSMHIAGRRSTSIRRSNWRRCCTRT